MSYIRNVIKKAGSVIGIRPKVNFIEGSNVTLTIADDSANDQVNVTIASTGGGGGSWGSITGTISSQTDLMSAISLRI